jgi:hypothetical protein
VCTVYLCNYTDCDGGSPSGSWVDGKWMCYNCKENIRKVMSAFDATNAKAIELLRSLMYRY